MILNERLKNLRLQSGVTQKAVADSIGIAELSFQRFEYGTSRPRLENIIKLADFFNVSLDYLVGRTDNPKMN